ncbi:pentatricopeptide repeat-containing protein At4g01570-like [Chenopodium quinoa]|uniref:pentatricopeptide repeat-containing protein At4g01570-like n=1 Tax=Chenopodium quinoa TaxID=63459 RepID=UPI000B76C7BB|nr:pentatricopeptide repeat-containing protein At4g01570-like [Chenopodium quinoa]
MSFVRRVLASTRKGLSLTYQIQINPPKSQLPFCNYHSTSSNLLQKLIKEPKSRIEIILDSEENSTLKSIGFSWDALLSAINSSSTSKANLALEWRLEKLLKHNERNQELFTELISHCGETRNLELAIRTFMAMESVGLKPTSDIFNSLILVSLRVGNEMTALGLFEVMERSEDYKPDAKTYNAFVSMYAKSDNVKAMQAWASAKRVSGIPADLQLYESLISGCVKAKRYDTAEFFYEEMISSGFIPNIHILNRMIDGLCEQQDIGRAKQFLLSIIDNGWAISPHIADRLSRLCSELGKIEGIEELLRILTASKESPEVLSRVHCGIIGMHARADRLDDMEYAVGRMLKQGSTFKSADDIKVIIRSYFRRAAYDRLELFLEHIKGSCQFTKSTYDLLVTGYGEAGLSEKLNMLLKELGLCETS